MSAHGIRTIVVGVDGSEHAAKAVEWAVRMAKGMGSEVVAVYAVDNPVTFGEAFVAVTPPQFDPAWRAEVENLFENVWCKPLRDAAVRYRPIMRDGRPATVVADVADEVDADVIVLGRRGRGGMAELVLGSVSHELVLHSARPVLLISHRQAAAKETPAGIAAGGR